MDFQPTSTRPYLLRALFEWCGDNGLTPHIAVLVDDSVVVPREFVKDGEIVLNISADAANGLRIDSDAVSFKARFSGVARDIYVPVGRVIALFARENGQGMAFPVEDALSHEVGLHEDSSSDAKPMMQLVGDADSHAPQVESSSLVDDSSSDQEPPNPPASPTGKPALRRIK